MAAERQSTLRQRLFAILVAGIGATAASAASFAMAVYDAANPEPIAAIDAGVQIDTGKWNVMLREAYLSPAPPTGIQPPTPTTFLTVEFDLENRSAASAYASTKLFTLDPPVEALPDFYLERDLWVAGPLNPGMRERMIATWELPAGQTPPHELSVMVGSQIYKRRDNLYGASGWFDREPAARVTLPVAARNESIAP
ncbi:MAG TPA: hypothetical protein VMF90_15180 [Rhizobiaceae bacterium]|nr:hypothetical protein [Rhizobiaceae bacterium]